jgi:RNA polymerase sigma-70 factor (ECF subfamily)
VRRRRETELEEVVVEPAAVDAADPERSAASREIGEGVEDCLTRLVHDRRLAVTLYLQGHSVPEAARVLDWPAKRTENLVYRGLADLRACLESKGLRP